jgi:hypothetical protein
MKTALAILGGMLVTLLPYAPCRADNIIGVAATFAADKFYRVCQTLDPRGLPTIDQMDRFAPLFTEDLTAMVEDVRRHRNNLVRENPTTKLPWREGNLFASLRRGFTFYAVGVPVILDDTATVPVHLEYRFQGQTTRWIDVIVLRRSDRHWLVDDIFLNAPWALTSGASLRSRLWLSMHQDPFRPNPETASAASPSSSPY